MWNQLKAVHVLKFAQYWNDFTHTYSNGSKDGCKVGFPVCEKTFYI